MFRFLLCLAVLAGGLFICSCGEEKKPFVVPDMIPNPVVQVPCVCDGRNCWGDCD